MITELKPTNLIAVEVLDDAVDYKIGAVGFTPKLSHPYLFYKTLSNGFGECPVQLKDGKYKIIGEATKDKIVFDVEPYVDKYNDGSYRDYENGKPFFPDNTCIDICLTKQESFYSLLESNGLYFKNPLEKPDLSDANGRQYDPSIDEDKAWQDYNHYKNKLIKGKLLVIEKL